MPRSAKSADAILTAALGLAETNDWEPLRLHEVAAHLGIGLEDVRKHFREKEELVEAWFDGADRAMLQAMESPDFQGLPEKERLLSLLTAWLEHLHRHHRITRQMIMGKLEPGHLHVQIPAILRISRTVQWWREAAGLQGAGLRRVMEETGLTTMFVLIFGRWLWDDSPEFRRSRQFMAGLLDGCSKCAAGSRGSVSPLRPQQ